MGFRMLNIINAARQHENCVKKSKDALARIREKISLGKREEAKSDFEDCRDWLKRQGEAEKILAKQLAAEFIVQYVSVDGIIYAAQNTSEVLRIHPSQIKHLT